MLSRYGENPDLDQGLQLELPDTKSDGASAVVPARVCEAHGSKCTESFYKSQVHAACDACRNLQLQVTCHCMHVIGNMAQMPSAVYFADAYPAFLPDPAQKTEALQDFLFRAVGEALAVM